MSDTGLRPAPARIRSSFQLYMEWVTFLMTVIIVWQLLRITGMLVILTHDLYMQMVDACRASSVFYGGVYHGQEHNFSDCSAQVHRLINGGSVYPTICSMGMAVGLTIPVWLERFDWPRNMLVRQVLMAAGFVAAIVAAGFYAEYFTEVYALIEDPVGFITSR